MEDTHDPEELARRRARVESQYWDRPRQAIRNAHPIPRRGLQHDCHIPVTARIVWEHDGEEHVDTLAFAYTSRFVLVEVDSRRYGIGGAWLAPGDVRRRWGAG